jgi:hypothetical protein
MTRLGAHDVRNGDHFAAADTPLHDLVAGRIDQAEYRRRMADLERRAADSLDVEPSPYRPRWHLVPPPPPRPHPILWVGLGVAWALGALVVGWLVIQIWIALTAAPLSAPDPTAPQPASDVAGLALASTVPAASSSGPGLIGAPLSPPVGGAP